MPAVTVDDLSVACPAIAAVRPRPDRARPGLGRSRPSPPPRRASRERDSRSGGPSPGVRLDRLDPFVHMDQMGEVEYAPGEAKGTAWHPHRGFETVTYIIDGTFQHQDSTGGGGVITNGDTQWMTAGSGILHIERPPEALVASGGLFHGIQLWVNLPAADKWVDPRYQDIGRDRVTLLSSPDGGALVRVIAGRVGEHRGPGDTYTPDHHGARHRGSGRPPRAALGPGRQRPGVRPGRSGPGRSRTAGPFRTGQLAVLGAGDTVVVAADQTQESRSPEPRRSCVLGGRPIGEPVAHYGPFVMNTRAELAQAFEDFQKGRMGTIPAAPVVD